MADNVFKNTGIIILAAGRGTRLNCSDKPKVLFAIGGQPIISYILETLEKGGWPQKQICLVVNFAAEKIRAECGPGYIYAYQEKCLGTAHAARTGEEALPADIDTILILNGDDSAFYTFASLNNFVNGHKKNNNDISLLTCEPADPQGLGRVIRDENNNVAAIVEKENMKPEHRDIREISTGTFCFKREWFREHYKNLKPIFGLGELGLPGLVDEALKHKARFQAIKLKDPDEWFGINTPEQLAEAKARKAARLRPLAFARR